GYLIETRKTEDNYSLRDMSPASYRILHLFVHAIIGILTPSQIVTKFINSQTNSDVNIIDDVISYCQRHVCNDWTALKNILACGDEQLALTCHLILSRMKQSPLQGVATKLKTSAEREAWEKNFSTQYVSPLVKNAIGSAAEFRKLLETKSANVQIKIESEINEIMKVDDGYRKENLPRIWRQIEIPNMDSFRAYYLNNPEHVRLFPFLKIFLKHENYLSLVQFIFPIVKFVQLLSSSLSYRLERKKARQMTFKELLAKECDDLNSDGSRRLMNEAFKEFSQAWNKLIPYVNRYKSQDLDKPPKMTENLPVVYGLIEPANESIYICAILDFLVQIQNKFLKDVIKIPSGKCQSLKFLEHRSDSQVIYHLKSIKLETAKTRHIVTYKDITEIFKYSQFDLRICHGQEITYDLFKIELELAHSLVFEKAILEPNEQDLYLGQFSYHKELFQGSTTILSEIKKFVVQESLIEEKKSQFIEMTNPKELLSILEMIICFLKRTSGGDREILITDYVKKWMKLMVLKEDNASYVLLTRSGLQLKHIVALYELVEEHVADVIAVCIHSKYKAKMSYTIEEEIKKAVNFDNHQETGNSSSNNNEKIPAEAFATALKRFILRHLSVGDSIIETDSLSAYLVQYEALECWPDSVQKRTIKSKFPKSLLISHTFEAYTFVKNELEKLQSKKRRQAEDQEARRKNSKTK
ncbi:9019_t:CDS:2, partial [Acaulospora morrowiae]